MNDAQINLIIWYLDEMWFEENVLKKDLLSHKICSSSVYSKDLNVHFLHPTATWILAFSIGK